MKQFIICFMLTIFLYLGGAMLEKSLNPMEWKNSMGDCILFIVIILVWIIPIYLNYMSGEKNFE